MQSFRTHAKRYLLAALFLANVAVWYAVFSEERGGMLTVAFLDVGQGDATFIEAPNGNQVLIDGGAGRAALRELSRVMPFYDRSIDMVLATHPDKDHIGGLPAVLDNFDVTVYVEPGLDDSSGTYRALVERVRAEGAETVIARRGMVFVLDDGIFLRVLFPDRDVTGFESNDASVVARLEYADTSFLLTGDSPQKIEKYLVALDGASLRTDVLKAGHHGSRTSTAAVFLGSVAPEFVVISSGKGNQYGHPHKEVMNILAAFGARVLRTDAFGTVLFESDGSRVRAISRRRFLGI